MEGLYDADHPRIWHLTTDEAPAIFHWITLSVAGSLFFIRALPDETITLESAARALPRRARRARSCCAPPRARIWRRRVPPERALVLGRGKLADAVARKLALEPGHHLSVLEYSAGHEQRAPATATAPRTAELKVEELSKEDLDFLLAEAGIERVVLARARARRGHAGAGRLLLPGDRREAERDAADAGHARHRRAAQPHRRDAGDRVRHLGHLAVHDGDQARRRRVLSAAGLVVLAPLMLVIALAVRLSSRGPALFRQIRAGRDGKPFKILKFRTMCRDAEERISEVISPDELTEPMFKLRKDPRVTKVGRFLRRTSLDELPQLFNVLRGDMSLVGPRPEELWLVERYGETQRFRLQMRPGLTGPMQVHGRGELNFQERLAVEREYVENYSIRKDLKILLRTVSIIWRGPGAY